MVLEPVDRSTITEEVVKRLIELVNSGITRPGEKLPSERELMEQLKVGRSSVREALRSLTLIGLLETRPGSGTYVTRDLSNFVIEQIEWMTLLGRHELLELYEVRTPLEIQAAVLAAERATSTHIERLEQAIQELETSGEDIEKEVEADLSLHTIIAQAAGNRVLFRLVSSLSSLLSETIRLSAAATETKMSTVEEHRAIMLAIKARDKEEARRAMTRHLEISKRLALESVEKGEQSEAQGKDSEEQDIPCS
jgi:GntR family transcriptional repressor for pyruvate dehydrogenase complex